MTTDKEKRHMIEALNRVKSYPPEDQDFIVWYAGSLMLQDTRLTADRAILDAADFFNGIKK